MKILIFCVVLCVSLSYGKNASDDNKKADDTKIYKRLIPADVLRGITINNNYYKRYLKLRRLNFKELIIEYNPTSYCSVYII